MQLHLRFPSYLTEIGKLCAACETNSRPSESVKKIPPQPSSLMACGRDIPAPQNSSNDMILIGYWMILSILAILVSECSMMHWLRLIRLLVRFALSFLCSTQLLFFLVLPCCCSLFFLVVARSSRFLPWSCPSPALSLPPFSASVDLF